MSSSPEETRRMGEILGRFLQPGNLVCLWGEIGSGKTVFAQGVARALEVPGPVTSPTFTIINEYQGRFPFYHMDAYRLEGEAGLGELGLEQYLEGDGVTLLEWPERLAAFLPERYLAVRLERESHGEGRIVTLEAVGDGFSGVLEGWVEHAGAGDR